MVTQRATSSASLVRSALRHPADRRPHLPLAAILALQGAGALVLLRNTASQDEAVYVSAGQQIFRALLGGPSVAVDATFAQYFSGDPYLYPVMAGVLNTIGGLEAVRLLSLAAGLTTTLCTYGITKQLFDRESAAFAAAIFAFQSSVLYIGRLATFDATCLVLLALSLVLALHVSVARRSIGALGIGPLLLLAVGMKYAALLFLPSVLAIFACESLYRRGWHHMVVRTGSAVASLLASVGVVLANRDRTLVSSLLAGMSLTTTNRVVLVPAPPGALVKETFMLGGFALAIGAAEFVMLLTARRRRLLALILVISALLAPAYHIYKGEAASFNKHLAFTAFFIAPLAGSAVSHLLRLARAHRFRGARPAAVALCLVILAAGLQQTHRQYHTWGNITGMVATLRCLVRPGEQRYLAEDMDIVHYYLEDATSPEQWVGPYWFQYTTKAGQQLTGPAAYNAAVADGYFSVIELSDAFLDAAFYQAVHSGMRDGGGYDLVAKVPYSSVNGIGYSWVWRKHVDNVDGHAQSLGGCSAKGATRSDKRRT